MILKAYKIRVGREFSKWKTNLQLRLDDDGMVILRKLAIHVLLRAMSAQVVKYCGIGVILTVNDEV